MATIDELSQAYVELLQKLPSAPPLTLMNHGLEEAALVIAAIVDRCAELKLGLRQVSMGHELAEELGLREGSALKHGEKPVVRAEPGLGREIRFELA